MKTDNIPQDIDTYISGFPDEIQILLLKIRAAIKDAAPEAGEKISYGIPTFTLNGNLVHFAAYKNHIGFYPGPSAIKEFEKDLSPYKVSKGTIQFQTGQPLPLSLITKIVKLRVMVNLEKEKSGNSRSATVKKFQRI